MESSYGRPTASSASGPGAGEVAWLLLFCGDSPSCSLLSHPSMQSGRSRGPPALCVLGNVAIEELLSSQPCPAVTWLDRLPPAPPHYSHTQIACAGRMKRLTVVHTRLPSLACAGCCAGGAFSLSAFQNPAHPSKSNSHINASLILAPEIDLCFSLQLCHYFTCPSWPLSNPPVLHKYLWVSFSPSLLCCNFVRHGTVLCIWKFFTKLKLRLFMHFVHVD